MKDELKQYQTTPDTFWQNACLYGDGYEVIGLAVDRKWKPIGGWGRDGYDLGSWPYVIILFRNRGDSFDLVYYVEGDIEQYACPTREIREQVCNELAFWHWNNDGEEWVKGYESVEQLPEELRGPYRAA